MLYILCFYVCVYPSIDYLGYERASVSQTRIESETLRFQDNHEAAHNATKANYILHKD